MKMEVLLLLCVLVTCQGRYQDDEWIDPTDMLNYDAAAGRMKHQKQYSTGKPVVVEDPESDGAAPGSCQADQMNCKTDATDWKQKDGKPVSSEQDGNEVRDESKEKEEGLETLRKEITEWREKGALPQSSCNPVFRRFLYRIINEAKLLGLPDESQPEVHYDAEMVLTKQMVAEFLRFLDDTDWNAGPLDEALGGTLVRFRPHNEDEWSWKFEDYIGTDPFSAFMISLSVLCLVMVVATELWTHISWLTQIRRLLALSFLVSIVWNWMYLYRDAFAERQAKLAKMGNEFSCGKQMTWSESLVEWWKSSATFQNDPCEEYFKALMVNPILLVPPTKAFAVTFTNFITEPLKHVGKGIGEFFHGLLSEMPLFYQPLVLAIIALVLLGFCYGFGTSLPHINRLRGNPDGERERLPPAYPERDGYDRYIGGGDAQYYGRPQPIQAQHAEGHREVHHRIPEVLRPEVLRPDALHPDALHPDALHPAILRPEICGDERQHEIAESSQQPQNKPERGTNQRRDENSGERRQNKDVPSEQRQHIQPPVKEISPGSRDLRKESIRDGDPAEDRISPVPRDVSRSHSDDPPAEVETLGNLIAESSRQPQNTPEKGTNQRRDEKSGERRQNKDVPSEQRQHIQPPVKEISPGSRDLRKESVRDGDPAEDRISPVPRDVSGSHSDDPPEVETLGNLSRFPEEAEVRGESGEENDQKEIREDGPRDLAATSPVAETVSAEQAGVLGTTLPPTDPPDRYLHEEDLYTDPGNEDSLSFVVIEEQDAALIN